MNCSFCVTDESRDTTNDLVGRHHWLGLAYCQTCIAVTPFKVELLPVTTLLRERQHSDQRVVRSLEVSPTHRSDSPRLHGVPRSQNGNTYSSMHRIVHGTVTNLAHGDTSRRGAVSTEGVLVGADGDRRNATKPTPEQESCKASMSCENNGALGRIRTCDTGLGEPASPPIRGSKRCSELAI